MASLLVQHGNLCPAQQEEGRRVLVARPCLPKRTSSSCASAKESLTLVKQLRLTQRVLLGGGKHVWAQFGWKQQVSLFTGVRNVIQIMSFFIIFLYNSSLDESDNMGSEPGCHMVFILLYTMTFCLVFSRDSPVTLVGNTKNM